MPIEVNELTVFVAAVANMVIGAIWYGPAFGKHWMRLSGITKEKVEAAHPNMGMLYLMGFIVSLLMAYVLAHFVAIASTTLSQALETAFWIWLGFVVTISFNSVIWGGRSKALWALDGAYYLVSLLIMSGILFIWS